MDPTKLDSKRLRELVDKYSYSDIGHCDVVDMRDPLPEVYQLVEDGHITESDFSDCIFGNAVRLWGTQNPRFFQGTRVAKEAAALLKASTPARAAA